MIFNYNDENLKNTEGSLLDLEESLKTLPITLVYQVNTQGTDCGFVFWCKSKNLLHFTGDGFKNHRRGKAGHAFNEALEILKIHGFTPIEVSTNLGKLASLHDKVPMVFYVVKKAMASYPVKD